MRPIQKGREPETLMQHRCSTHVDFDNYKDKDGLREHLVREQRGLCCFCMSRISPSQAKMKIAHWHPIDTHPLEQLDYGNLLAACKGGEGQARKHQHCDTHQKNDELSRNPANPEHQVDRDIGYRSDGTIYSGDPTFNRDLDIVLNLNVAFLKNNRRMALDSFTAGLRKRGHLQRPALENLLATWNGDRDDAELRPYCQVIVYWLRKRLRRDG